MRGRSSYFYADHRDLMCLLESFQALKGYKYVEIRSELNHPTKIYNTPSKILHKAMVTPDKPIRTHSFLIMEKEEKVNSKDILLADGNGIIKRADQNNNFNSAVIAFGGNAGHQTILMSDVNTVGDTEKSIEIYKEFRKIILANTTRVGVKGKPYRLMSGALEKLKSDWHLTQNKVWSPGVEEIKLSKMEFAKLGSSASTGKYAN